MSRLRVPINQRVPLSFFLVVIGFVSLMTAVCAQAGEKILLANSPGDSGYRTTVIATGGPLDSTVRLTDVLISGADLKIPANGYAIARDVAGSKEFALIDAPTGASIMSVLTYRSPSLVTSFVIPPFGSFSANAPSKVGPIVVDEQDGTWLTVFAAEATPVYVRIYDGNGVAVGVETFDARPPVTQYRLQTPVAVGSAIVSITTGPQWGCFPRECSSYAPLYGFASSSSPTSGNMRVMPFGH